MRPAKIQISLRFRESDQNLHLALFFLIAEDAWLLHAENEDSEQAARMRRPT